MRRGVLLYHNYACKELEGKIIDVIMVGNSFMVRKEAVKKSRVSTLAEDTIVV